MFYYAENNNPVHKNIVSFTVSKEMDKYVQNVVAFPDEIVLLQKSAININITQAQ